MTRCVHCGKEVAEKTRDHVFPASWYPSTTPPEIQRWTVPSCKECNGTLGEMEKELFVRLAICTDPQKSEAAGLSSKAVRSMGVGAERLTFRDRLHRKALKWKIMKEMRPYKPGTETFPGFGPHSGFPEHEQMSIPIPATLLENVAKKIVRGCEYALAKRVTDKPYEISVYFVHKKDVPAKVVQAFEGPSAQTTYLGPGFKVTRVTAHDEPNTVLYKIVVWDTLVIYASILPDDEN